MNKPTYSQSRIVKYLKCPKSFELSLQHQPVFGTSTQRVMKEGNLFEGYVFGFKEEEGEKSEKELIGRKKPATIEPLKKQAAHVSPLFLDGESYHFISVETDNYIARGELDFMGEIDTEYLQRLTGRSLTPGEYIVDLKRTGDIGRIWDWKDSKEEYLQSAYYTYLVWKKLGIRLPFLYIVVEDKYETPIVRCIEVQITDDDLLWVEQLINTVHNDFIKAAEPNHSNCLGGKMQARCSYLQFCEHGRRLAGGSQVIDFSALRSKLG